jgi:hypothetical protein
MDARGGCGFDGAGGGFDVLPFRTGKSGDAWALDLPRDDPHGFKVAVGGDGEACLDDVDAERRELVGHAELFAVVHGAARGLFAVAEGGVEEDDFVWIDHRKLALPIWTLS